MFVSVFSLLVNGLTIKMPLTVNICLCFNLTHTSSTLVMVHPIVSGVWLGPLGVEPDP